MALKFGTKLVSFPVSACAEDPEYIVRAVTRGKLGKITPARGGSPRSPEHWTSGFVVHTSCGTVDHTQAASIDSTLDAAYATSEARVGQVVSWHLNIDLDGSVIQSADARWRCNHACQVNQWTDACELMQTNSGRVLTTPQLRAFVQVMDVWTRETGIPRIIPWRNGKPYAGMLTRALEEHGSGRDLCCVYGHRNVWHRDAHGVLQEYRGAGDPSDFPFLALADPSSVGLSGPGYLCWDVEAGEDKDRVRAIQRELGENEDGVYGPIMRRLRGQLVWRPGDVGHPA